MKPRSLGIARELRQTVLNFISSFLEGIVHEILLLREEHYCLYVEIELRRIRRLNKNVKHTSFTIFLLH